MIVNHWKNDIFVNCYKIVWNKWTKILIDNIPLDRGKIKSPSIVFDEAIKILPRNNRTDIVIIRIK